MTYSEIVAIIQNKRRFESKSGYEVSTELLRLLDSPESGMQTVHIAGTNGKGSTAAFLSEILQAAGFCVGLFTSPHLVSFRERIRVDGKEIPEADVIRLGEQVLLAEQALLFSATMFDIALAMAVLYFKERHCDYVILETGLGGAKDSTRALSVVPKVSVITRIGYDHEAVLGNTLTKIAAEKAGILRQGTRAVIARMEEKASQVIKERCDSLLIPYQMSSDVALPKGVTSYGYQKENMENAVCAARLLGTPEQAILSGLQSAYWPGRLDVISRDPFLMLDGAHNPQGVQALKQSLLELYPGEKFLFLVGILADKDYTHMLLPMVELGVHFYAVTVDSQRAMQGREIAEFLNRLLKSGATGYGNAVVDSREKNANIAEAVEGLSETLSLAIARQQTTGEKIVVFGSLYFIGEVMEWKC